MHTAKHSRSAGCPCPSRRLLSFEFTIIAVESFNVSRSLRYTSNRLGKYVWLDSSLANQVSVKHSTSYGNRSISMLMLSLLVIHLTLLQYIGSSPISAKLTSERYLLPNLVLVALRMRSVSCWCGSAAPSKEGCCDADVLPK